ncbi:MAG TPA: FtsX-like permease family protein [Chloroflexota bacterium]
MPSLIDLAIRNLTHHRIRSLLAVLAVVLGTAVVSATFTTNAAIESSLQRSGASLVGNADLVVEAVDQRGFPERAVAATRAIPGVASVAPQVTKRTYFRTQDQRGFVELVGIDPQLDPQVHPYTVTAGDFLTSPQQHAVLLVKDWADRMGIRAGDRVELLTTDGFQNFDVAGLLDEPDQSERTSTGVVRLPLAVAQATFGLQDHVDRLSIKLTNPAQMQAVEDRLPDAIPTRFLVKETPRQLKDLEDSIRDFQGALLFFGAIALVAGAFLVFNELSLTVVEQGRQIGLLRATGATAGTILQMTMIQGAALGVVGSVLGVVVGEGLARVLVLLVGASQGTQPPPVPFSPLGIGLSLIVGLVITLGASLVPAVEASSISPLMALGANRPTLSERTQRLRTLVALVVTALVVAFLLRPVETEGMRALKLVSLLVLFLLVIYLSQVLVPFLAPIVALPFRWLFRSTGLLAERNVRRERARTGVTVAGFVISLSLIIALWNSSTSFTRAGEAWARAIFPADFVVVSAVDQPLTLTQEFSSLPGVDPLSGVSPISVFPVVWEGYSLTAAAVDPSVYFQAFEFVKGERPEAFRAMQRGNGVLVPELFAREQQLEIDDNLLFKYGNRETVFTVVGVISHSLPSADGFGTIVVPRASAESEFGVRDFRFLAVRAAPDADLRQLGSHLGETAELFGMESQSVTSLRESVARGVGGLFSLLVGLVVIGVVVGSLSVVNTMVMNIAQRIREIATLRAQGMTTGQVQQLAVAEATTMGLLGAIVGILLGAFVTWVLVGLNRTADFDPVFTFSPQAALVVLLLGGLSAALAAFYPATLAARINPIEALRHE